MDVLSVTFFNMVTSAKDALSYGFGFSMVAQKDTLRDDVVKALQTFRDMRKYVLENLGVEVPTDQHTSIRYDEVTLRRLTQTKKTLEAVAHAGGNFERVSTFQEYKEALSVVAQFRRHIQEQIKKTGD
jgi:hypothetical protein